MHNKLFIIGNGFDLSHGMPTSFNKDFKRIANQDEISNYWDFYSGEEDIWSDFEHALGKPNFNGLEKLFEGLWPDYSSDHETDRDSIIFVAEEGGNLNKSLNEFAVQAEEYLAYVKPQEKFKNMFQPEDLFLSFNYTHTLEKIYGVKASNVLHIHGDVYGEKLMMGYPEGEYQPEVYCYDYTMKGKQYAEVRDMDVFVSTIEDSYVHTAWSILLKKTKSYKKEIKISLLEDFLLRSHIKIDEIIVYGHSCSIDLPYFRYLVEFYGDIKWIFYVHDDIQKSNVMALVKTCTISNYVLMDC